MMTKDSLRKQIIVLIGNDNKSKFIASSNIHIININSILRNIKSDVMRFCSDRSTWHYHYCYGLRLKVFKR